MPSSSPEPFPFDAVLFDLDGTLVATERFWPDAARAGALAAFRELGIERPLPTHAEWMGLVGLSLAEGFDALFADLEPEQRRVLLARCVEAEEALLADGRAALLPGVRETLDALRARGVRMGIASNCGAGYLDAMLDGLGLSEWIEEGRCLDSPRVADKADMVEDLLATFGTRSAVMVGDRLGDRAAAWANGLPHVHLARGYAAVGEHVEAEAVIEGLDALVPRLERRAAWLAGVLAALDLPAGGGRVSLGVTGGPAAGKSLFARDLARALGGAVVPLAAFRGGGAASERDPLADVALPLLIEGVLAPHARGEAVEVDAPAGRLAVPAGVALVLEGPFLLDPRLASTLERVLHLTVPEALAERRVAGRDGRLAGPGPVARLRDEALPLQRAFEARHPPAERASLVIDAANALGPA